MARPNNDVQSIFSSQTGAATFVPMQQGQPIAPSNVRGSFLRPSAYNPTHTVPLAAPVNMQTDQSNLLSEPGLQVPVNMEFNAPTSSLSSVKSAPSKDKVEMKSTVWADTLTKTNPHADIGVDFDSINRKDKWKGEMKLSTAPMSTTTMGKAMGSGSGIGRAGASILSASLNPMVGSGVGMGMGMMGGGAIAQGIRVGGYSRPMGMNDDDGLEPGNAPQGMGYNLPRPQEITALSRSRAPPLLVPVRQRP